MHLPVEQSLLQSQRHPRESLKHLKSEYMYIILLSIINMLLFFYSLSVALSAHAADSGSPLDEHVFMKVANSNDLFVLLAVYHSSQLQIGQAVEDFESQLLEATVSTSVALRTAILMTISQSVVLV